MSIATRDLPACRVSGDYNIARLCIAVNNAVGYVAAFLGLGGRCHGHGSTLSEKEGENERGPPTPDYIPSTASYHLRHLTKKRQHSGASDGIAISKAVLVALHST